MMRNKVVNLEAYKKFRPMIINIRKFKKQYRNLKNKVIKIFK